MKQCGTCKFNRGSYCSSRECEIERGVCSGYQEKETRGNFSKSKTFNQLHPLTDRHFTERYSIPRF